MKSHSNTQGAAGMVLAAAGLACCVGLCGIGLLSAAESVGWRNDGTGRFEVSEPPIRWSAEENIAWKAELPGRGIGSPVVAGERVLVTANPSELVCLSLDEGRELWRRTHGYAEVFGPDEGERIERDHQQARQLEEQIGQLRRQQKEAEQAGRTDSKEQFQSQIGELNRQVRELREFPPPAGGEPGNTGATPVSDGRNVFAMFGVGIVSSHTLDGKRNWIEYVEAGGSDQTASPLLVDGKLIVHLRSLTALDADTGRVLWRTETPARHGSPVAAQLDGEPVVVTPAGALVRLSDGELLAGDLFRLGHCSPLVDDDMVYAMENGSLKALKLDLVPSPSNKPTLPVVWEVESSRTNRLASPVVHEGLLYGITEQGILEVNEANTGEQVYRKRLSLGGGRADPSLCLAGGLLYISSNRGTTLVVRPGREYEEVARNSLADFSSSPCFAGSRLLIRTKNDLWCIGR